MYFGVELVFLIDCCGGLPSSNLVIKTNLWKTKHLFGIAEKLFEIFLFYRPRILEMTACIPFYQHGIT